MELISREAVKQCFKDWHEQVPLRLAGLIKGVAELPVIESRPKGKWIEDTGLYATCSNCKENLYQAIEYKFCPNCGADMREVKSGER